MYNVTAQDLDMVLYDKQEMGVVYINSKSNGGPSTLSKSQGGANNVPAQDKKKPAKCKIIFHFFPLIYQSK